MPPKTLFIREHVKRPARNERFRHAPAGLAAILAPPITALRVQLFAAPDSAAGLPSSSPYAIKNQFPFLKQPALILCEVPDQDEIVAQPSRTLRKCAVIIPNGRPYAPFAGSNDLKLADKGRSSVCSLRGLVEVKSKQIVINRQRVLLELFP